MELLECPRCKAKLSATNRGHEADSSFMPCESCGFEFAVCAFRKQSERSAQQRAHPEDLHKQKLVSDHPLERTCRRGITMSIAERVRWWLRQRQVVATLTLRSGVHQLLYHCTRLCERYPAIPRNLGTVDELERFWIDPRDKFILDAVWDWAVDVSKTTQALRDSKDLEQSEVRKVIDEELPHSLWGGSLRTYRVFSPEIKGLLLAAIMFKAQGKSLPGVLDRLLSWIDEDGWDEYGHAKAGGNPEPLC